MLVGAGGSRGGEAMSHELYILIGFMGGLAFSAMCLAIFCAVCDDGPEEPKLLDPGWDKEPK